MTGLEEFDKLVHEIEACRAGTAPTASVHDLAEVLGALEMMRDWLERVGTEAAREQIASVLDEHNWSSPTALVTQSHEGLVTGLCALLKSVLGQEIYHSLRT